MVSLRDFMKVKRELDLALLRIVGSQVALGRVLTCPTCGEDQNLSSFGDQEELLFCPHCEMEIGLTMVRREGI